MKGILLAGRNRSQQILEPRQIDNQIARLRALGIEPAIVLGGDSAEDILRCNRTVETCEIAFDTHLEPTDFTNLLAAAHLTEGEFLACLPDLANLDAGSLATFRHHLVVHYQEPFHIIRIQETGPWPLLVTAKGQKFLAESEGLSHWEDPRVLQFSAPLTRQVIPRTAGAV